MTTFAFSVTVSGLNLDDSDALEALVCSADFILVASESDGVCVLDVEIEADSGENALAKFTAHVSATPSISIDRVSEDLVNTSEIALRLNVSREAVRTWVKGERGAAGFPKHRVVVGGQKAWAWSTVYAWAAVTRSIPEDLPQPIDVSCVDWFNGTHNIAHLPESSKSWEVRFATDVHSVEYQSIEMSINSAKLSRAVNQWQKMVALWFEEGRVGLDVFRPSLSGSSPPSYESREGGTYIQTMERTIMRAGR